MKSTLSKYYWLKSGLLTILQNMSGVLLGFGGFYILVRILSKHEFGAWTLFMSTATILEIIRNGLIQNALIRFISAAEKKDHPEIISASFCISGGLTIFCVLINICFSHFLANIWDTPELIPVFYTFNIVYVLSGIITQFNCIEQANLNYQGVFISTLVRQSIFFAYILACFIFKLQVTLMHLVEVQIIATLMSAITAWFYVKKHLVFSLSYSKEWGKKLFNYGKFAFGTSISSILSGTIDQMMLGAMLSPVASGAYNVAVRIVNLIDIPTNSIAVIVFPQSAKRLATDGPQAVKYLYEKSVGTILAILIPGLVFIFFFSDFVVGFIAGGKYADTVPLLRVTIFYCLLIPFGRQFGTVLDSIGKTKVTFLIVLLTATTNLLLNYFFIRSIGVMGAAYATLLSNIIGFIIGQIILYRELKVNTFNSFIYALKFYPEFFNRYIKRSHIG